MPERVGAGGTEQLTDGTHRTKIVRMAAVIGLAGAGVAFDQLRSARNTEVILKGLHAFFTQFDCGSEWPEPWHRVFLKRFANLHM